MKKRKKVVTTETWIKRVQTTIEYPFTVMMVVSGTLAVACKSPWLAIPGIVASLWSTLYLFWIGDPIRAAYKSWKTSHERSIELPTGIWGMHVRLHSIFIAKQQVFLWITFLIGKIVYIGIIVFCELTYGTNDIRQTPPGPAMQKMVYSSFVGIAVSLWGCYIKLHLDWIADDERRKKDAENEALQRFL